MHASMGQLFLSMPMESNYQEHPSFTEDPVFSMPMESNYQEYPSFIEDPVLSMPMESNYQEYPSFIEDPVDFYWNSLPPGFRFAPSDAELILYYLQKKMLKQQLPLNKIREIDIYQYHPQDLAETQLNRHGEQEWYFFTPRERKYAHGSRPNRTADHGNGFWKVTGKDEVITLASGARIGFKNTLDYFEGTHSENQKTKWKMHEYRLRKSEKDEDIAASNDGEKNQRDMKLDDCVLCKIYTSNRCKEGKRKRTAAKRSLNPDDQNKGVHEHENQVQDSGVTHCLSGPINNFNNQNNTQHNVPSSFNTHVMNFERSLKADKKPRK